MGGGGGAAALSQDLETGAGPSHRRRRERVRHPRSAHHHAKLSAVLSELGHHCPTCASFQVAFEADDIFVKEPMADERTPWHRDIATIPFSPAGEGPRMLNIWMALDNIPCLTSLRLLPGSHKWPPGQLGNQEQEDFAALRLGAGWRKAAEEVLPLSSTISQEDKDDFVATFAMEQLDLADPEGFEAAFHPVSYDLQAGDCIVFHRQAIHGARGNHMPQCRAALSTRWCTHSRGHPELRPRYQQDTLEGVLEGRRR